MAVYTHICEEDLKQTLAVFGLGALVSLRGIPEGVENTNYQITTDKGQFILTLFEKRVNPEELPFYISFMEHLRRQGIPCPAVHETKEGRHVVDIKGKPAILTTFLEGNWPQEITASHCGAIGDLLAKMHTATKSFSIKRRNVLALPAWRSLICACQVSADSLETGLFDFLVRELDFLEEHWPQQLPAGVIHADLFPDNVFFRGESISGVIDFYFACSEKLVYDLMLTLNPWCFDRDGRLDTQRSAALLTRYHGIRPLTKAELKSLPFFGRAAAVRIIATRLYDWLNPAKGALVKPKDPREHVRILRFHQQASGPADYGFRP